MSEDICAWYAASPRAIWLTEVHNPRGIFQYPHISFVYSVRIKKLTRASFSVYMQKYIVNEALVQTVSFARTSRYVWIREPL